MTTDLDELLKILDEIIQLLESDDEQHWSKWMRQARGRLQNADLSGIEHLLSAYGGMGSFNDLMIFQRYENGEFRFKEGYVEKNDRLRELRSKAWELADAIRRDYMKSSS